MSDRMIVEVDLTEAFSMFMKLIETHRESNMEEGGNLREMNMDMLKSIFINEVPSFVSVSMESELDSGLCLDEIFGDDIFEAAGIDTSIEG